MQMAHWEVVNAQHLEDLAQIKLDNANQTEIDRALAARTAAHRNTLEKKEAYVKAAKSPDNAKAYADMSFKPPGGVNPTPPPPKSQPPGGHNPTPQPPAGR